MSDTESSVQIPELSEEKLNKFDLESGKRKWNHLKFQCEETLAHLEFVREEAKDIKNFWPLALLQHIVVGRQACTSSSDREALSYLSEVELKQDPKDPRPFELIFHFRENPFFSNTTLSKKYSLPEGTEAVPEDGSITLDMAHFEPDDLVPSSTTIDWKSDEQNLCKRFPRDKAQVLEEQDIDDDDFDGDTGSFFHYFTESYDPYELRAILHDDLLPEAIEYFLGRGANGSLDDDEDDELDEEDDEDEIDLEEAEMPRKKMKV